MKKQVLSILLAAAILLSLIFGTATVGAAAERFGDTDGDGEVTILDATSIQRHLAELKTLDERAIARSKVLGDDDLTIMDATSIQRYIAELIDRFPAGEFLPDEDADVMTIRFTNKNNWKDVHAYVYNYSTEEALCEWPGAAMTDAGLDGAGKTILTVDVDLSKYDRVIFNSGTLQTSPVPVTKASSHFTLAGKSGNRYTAGLVPDEENGKGKIETVYLDYPDGYEKKIFIWTPEGYDPEDTEKQYSTLYMTDGQNVLDKIYSYSGVEWQCDETVMTLMQNGGDGVIIVAIDNSDGMRETELTPDLGEFHPMMIEAMAAEGMDSFECRADVFAGFVVNDLIPYVESQYNVNDVRGFAGSSCGGQAAFYIGMEYPETFSYIGAFSSAFSYFTDESWDNYLSTKDFSGKVPRLYLYTGTNQNDKTESWISVSSVKMEGWLLDHGYPADQLYNVVDEFAMHHERYWALYFPEMLCWGMEV